MANIVVAQIAGGLGNQLFMYAASRALAWRNSAELVAETGVFRRDSVYRRQWLLDAFAGPGAVKQVDYHRGLSRYWRRLELELTLRFPSKRRIAYMEKTPAAFQPEVYAASARKIRLHGYWQSERYFEDCRERLLSDLRFVATISQETAALAREIEAEADPVAVHLRSYKDIPNALERSVLPMEYALAACARIRDAAPQARFYLFSDRPEEYGPVAHAVQNSRWVAHNQARGNLGAVEDLYLMSRCRHFVVANSSLSWWGAWLSQQRWGLSPRGSPAVGRRVIAPKERLFNADFVPGGWETLG